MADSNSPEFDHEASFETFAQLPRDGNGNDTLDQVAAAVVTPVASIAVILNTPHVIMAKDSSTDNDTDDDDNTTRRPVSVVALRALARRA